MSRQRKTPPPFGDGAFACRWAGYFDLVVFRVVFRVGLRVALGMAASVVLFRAGRQTICTNSWHTQVLLLGLGGSDLATEGGFGCRRPSAEAPDRTGQVAPAPVLLQLLHGPHPSQKASRRLCPQMGAAKSLLVRHGFLIRLNDRLSRLRFRLSAFSGWGGSRRRTATGSSRC